MTAVDAVNRAFSGIGHDVTIDSLDEASREGRLAKVFYAVTLETLAAGWDWPFLMHRADVAVEADGGIAIPSDCLRVVALRCGRHKIEAVRRGGRLWLEPKQWRVESGGWKVGAWACGCAPSLVLEYVSKDFELDDTPISFQVAFISALGEVFVAPLTKDANKMKLAGERASMARNRAQYDANNDQRSVGNDGDVYIRARW